MNPDLLEMLKVMGISPDSLAVEPQAEEVEAEAEAEETEPLPKAGRYFADVVMNPGKLAASGLATVHANQYSADPATGEPRQGVTFGALAEALENLMVEALSPSSGMEVIERHLLASIVLLGNVTTAWLTYSLKAEGTDKAEVFGRLALKAQEQQRKTLKTLADLRSPKRVAFIKQLNAAHQQIVNNGGKSPVVADHENFMDRNPSELLEVIPSERLDTRTQSPASGADSQLATLGAVHRPQDRSR